MTIRNLSPSTQQSYIYAIVKFSRHFGCSPDQLNLEQVRAYQLHLIHQKRPWSHITKSPAHCGSFTVSRWGRRRRSSGLSAARSPELPLVLTGEEIARFLQAVSGLRKPPSRQPPMRRACARARSTA